MAMETSPSLSMYSSIIPTYKKLQWEKLDDNEPLAQLHRKFWLQPKSKLLDIHQDEGAEEDEDDEIGLGCYILDIGIPNIKISQLWIRKEYIRLYRRCDEYLEANRHRQKSPSVVITGQPGIGKSYWIVYALCRRLAEGKPVIWFRSLSRYLFVDEGVFVEPKGYPPYPAPDFSTEIWTLIDSDEDNKGVPPHLVVHDTKHLIILCSSPQSDRWKPLGKTTGGVVVVMNPWTREEILRAAPIHGLIASDQRLDDMYRRFGPVPQICFNALDDDDILTEHIGRYKRALKDLSLKTLRDMVSGIFDFKMVPVSHTIILMRRADASGRSSWTSTSVEPISRAVEIDLRNQLDKETREERLQLYESLASVEGTRRVAGVLYESLAQSKLLMRAQLNLVPMTRKLAGFGGVRSPRWHSDHTDGVNPSSVPIVIEPVRKEVYESRPDQIEDRVYYAPDIPNQVAFDAFMMANKKLYIFQFTIGLEHGIKEGIVSFFVQESLPPKVDWHFVFVVPPGHRSLSCPQPRDPGSVALLGEMKLFTAVLDPK